MKINELRLTSFGKFQNKTLKFNEGINIVYGLNEAGKSTIHKFIEGMIFGFFRPDIRTRRQLDEHEQYNPRGADRYAGSMIITYKGRKLLIERNFTWGSGSLKIFDNVTGEDISATLPFNSTTRLPDLAAYLEIDYTLYNDTISVSQMQSETSSNLADVVVEKISNLTTSKTETISVPNVLNKVEEERRKIGSKNAITQPYALALAKKQRLNTELETSNTKYTEIQSHQAALKSLNDEKAIVEKKINTLIAQKELYKNEQLKEQYKVIKALDDEKNDLTVKASELAKFAKANEEDYQKALLINQQKESATTLLTEKAAEKAALTAKNAALETKLNLYPYLQTNEVTLLDLNTMYSAYNLSKTQLNSYNEETKALSGAEVTQEELKDLSKDYAEYNAVNAKNYDLLKRNVQYDLRFEEEKLVRLESELPSQGLKYLYIALIPLLIGIFLLLNFLNKIKRVKPQIAKQTTRIAELHEELKALEEQETSQKVFNEKMYVKYKVHTHEQLSSLYYQTGAGSRAANKARLEKLETLISEEKVKLEKISNELLEILKQVTSKVTITDQNIQALQLIVSEYATVKTDFSSNNKKLEEVTQEITATTTKSAELTKELTALYEANNVKSLEEFRTALAQKKLYLAKVANINNLTARMNDQLAGLTLEEFVAKIDFTTAEKFDQAAYEALLNEESNIRQKESELTKQIATYYEAISHLERNHREPKLIEAEITAVDEELSAYDVELAALQLIKTTLEELASTIRFEFAPELNKAISKSVKRITNNKYNVVKVDTAMNVLVYEEDTQSEVNIKGFSMGTIDQIYLAMRLGINETVSPNTHPLILDDTFVNYDYIRLEATLRILSGETKATSRQIILFTCHDREQKVLEALKVPFKLNSL
ncbi:MAG TPA: AAA family ATPase [Bacilli bacterium]|nr:AAA family ATPase [Bacilli bacterium]